MGAIAPLGILLTFSGSFKKKAKRDPLKIPKVDEIRGVFILEGVGWFYIKARPLTNNCYVGRTEQ